MMCVHWVSWFWTNWPGPSVLQRVRSMTRAGPHPSHAIWMVVKWLSQRVTAPVAQQESRSLGLTEAPRAGLFMWVRGGGSHPAAFSGLHWHFQGTALPVSHCHILRLPGTIPLGCWQREESEGWTSKNMVPWYKEEKQEYKLEGRISPPSASVVSWSPLSVWDTLHIVHFSFQDSVFGGFSGQKQKMWKGQNEKQIHKAAY